MLGAAVVTAGARMEDQGAWLLLLGHEELPCITLALGGLVLLSSLPRLSWMLLASACELLGCAAAAPVVLLVERLRCWRHAN